MYKQGILTQPKVIFLMPKTVYSMSGAGIFRKMLIVILCCYLVDFTALPWQFLVGCCVLLENVEWNTGKLEWYTGEALELEYVRECNIIRETLERIFFLCFHSLWLYFFFFFLEHWLIQNIQICFSLFSWWFQVQGRFEVGGEWEWNTHVRGSWVSFLETIGNTCVIEWSHCLTGLGWGVSLGNSFCVPSDLDLWSLEFL